MDRQSVILNVLVLLIDKIDDADNVDENLSPGKFAYINYALTFDHIQFWWIRAFFLILCQEGGAVDVFLMDWYLFLFH